METTTENYPSLAAEIARDWLADAPPVAAMVRARLVTGQPIECHGSLLPEHVKLAVLLVHALNRHEILSADEAGILYGCSRTAINGKELSGAITEALRINRGK